MKPSSKETQLARELAANLNDWGSLALYESYVQNYPESFLRIILMEVLDVPEHKIKKSRAALFIYLVKKYAHTKHNNHRD